MQQRSKKGWVAFTIVAVAALGSTIASAGLGRRADHELAEAREKVSVECTGSAELRAGGDAWKARPVQCGQASAPIVPDFRRGIEQLDAARAASQLGRPSDVAANLVKVLERADDIDRRRSVVASLLAAKLFDGVAERVDAAPWLLGDPRLVAAIRRSSFASSRHPLDSERLRAKATLSGVPGQIPIRTIGFAEWSTTQAMNDVDETLRAMDADVLAGDVKACETDALGSKGLAKQVTVGPSICKTARAIVESGQRLRRLQLRAAAKSQHMNTRTARSTPLTL
jgi:hypothetical protein